METPKAASGLGKADAAKVLGRLEQLEKAVAQDSVREVGRKYLTLTFQPDLASYSPFNPIL